MNINGSSVSTITSGDAEGRNPNGSDAALALRRRNRRVGILLAVIFLVLVLLCGAYIHWYGGTNKPPMKPYHVGRILTDSPRTS
jgi:hypothetical protein